MTSIDVIAETDHLKKIAKAKPSIAIAEIVWNALDADASKVEISYIGSEIGTDKIIIRDNGSGFDYEIAQKYFGSLGGSWKNEKIKSPDGRQLHGKQGQGRFKIFSLGEFVEWNVQYKKGNKTFSYRISGKESLLKKFQLSDEKEIDSNDTGVSVEISNLFKQYKIYDTEISLSTFSSIFAPYIKNYKNVSILINGQNLDIEDQILNTEELTLETVIKDEDIEYSFNLDLLEWKDLKIKELYLCDRNGFPFKKYEKQIRYIGEYGFTAYLKSDYFSLLNSNGEIELSEMKDELSETLSESIRVIKNYFVEKYIDDQKNIIDEWKKENVYPYKEEPKQDSIESAEQKVFDILALNLNDHISDFNSASISQKTLQFQLLKQAVERNPNELNRIIKEVLNLPESKIEELSEILEYSSLGSIISASKVIADRIKFINSFEEIVFEPEIKKNLKERSQLHKILADNTWFFGDEFHMSVNDQSLTEVLKKHKEYIGKDIIIDVPVKRIDKTNGIVDLMFSRSIPKNHQNEREHLVVELKAPKVKIGQKEIAQIESYAFAIAKDERFHGLDVRWEFWILSSHLDPYAEMKANQDSYPKGTIFKSTKDVNITIKAKTWSEIISEARHRHEFIRNQLDLNIGKEDSMQFLKEKYSQYVGDVLEESDNNEE